MSADEEAMATFYESQRADDERDRIVAALVRRFKPEPNSLAPEDPADFSTNIVFRAEDGYNSIRALTFGEIADALVEDGW